MPVAPILDVPDLKQRGAEPFGGANAGPWRQGGNAFGAIGVLGTTDAFPMTIIAENEQVFFSNGTLTVLGSVVANAATRLQGNGTGGVQLLTTAGGNISVVADTTGTLILDTGGGSITIGGVANAKTITIGNTVGATTIAMFSGTGGISLTAGGPGITLTGVGAGSILLQPGATGFVDLNPRDVGAGNTTQLRFFDLGGTNNISFRSVDALVASLQFRWPPADAIAANARAAMLTDAAGNLFFGNSIQSGTASLVAGVSAAIPANITASSLIFVQAGAITPGAGNLTRFYNPLPADTVIGTPGSFKITALIDAGTINVNDVSANLFWMVLNP